MLHVLTTHAQNAAAKEKERCRAAQRRSREIIREQLREAEDGIALLKEQLAEVVRVQVCGSRVEIETLTDQSTDAGGAYCWPGSGCGSPFNMW